MRSGGSWAQTNTGRKELLAMTDGFRESTQRRWREVRSISSVVA